jgi:glutamate--cysteine ligase
MSPLAVQDSFSVDEFVSYALRHVPMIFVRRGQRYSGSFINTSFAEFLERQARDEFAPVFQDWTDHLTTIFTDARLKQYLELRSVDCHNLPLSLAAVALCKGLFYDPTTLREALPVVPNLAADEARRWRDAVARDALAARVNNIDTLDLAKQIIALATDGLRRIAPEEVNYLDPIRQLVFEDEMCPADVLLRNWHGSWHGSISRLAEYLACP